MTNLFLTIICVVSTIFLVLVLLSGARRVGCPNCKWEGSYRAWKKDGKCPFCGSTDPPRELVKGEKKNEPEEEK